MEVNYIFNDHKSYTEEFLSSLKNKINKNNDILLDEEDLLIYNTNEMKVMIDDVATVYISNKVNYLSEIGEAVKNAVSEYNSLCSIEKIFNSRTPLSVLIPNKSIEEIELKDLPYSYTAREVDNDLALSMFID